MRAGLVGLLCRGSTPELRTQFDAAHCMLACVCEGKLGGDKHFSNEAWHSYFFMPFLTSNFACFACTCQQGDGCRMYAGLIYVASQACISACLHADRSLYSKIAM